MESKIFKVLWILVLSIGLVISAVQSQKQGCEGQNAPVQCVLYREYKNLDNDIACQLCAVALEYDSTLQKARKFCNNNEGDLRSCGLTSFAYLLLQKKFIQAFDLQYGIFYRDPFNHDLKVSSILKKQSIRSSLISWLEINQENTKSKTLLQKSIVNLYLDDMIESENQLGKYLLQNKQKLDKRTVKLKCRILQKQGQFNEAQHILSKHIKQSQNNQRKYQQMLQPYLYHLNGNLLMHHLKFNQAILQFKKASNMFKAEKQDVKFMRGFRLSNYNIGLCYQKLSKFDEAVKIYNELIQYVEKNAQILNALGNSYVEWAQQQYQSKLYEQKLRTGIFYLSRAIDMNPQYYIAYYNLGYAYLKSNALQQAIQRFNQSLSIQRTRQAEYGLLAAYLRLKNFQQVQTLLSTLNIDDESVDDLLSVYYENTNAKQNQSFYNKVMAQYEPFIKSANGHYWKGMIEFEHQNYGLAIAHFLQSYDKGYAEPHLLFNLAYAYELIGDNQQALGYYEKAFKKDPRKQTKQKIEENKKILKQKSTNHHQQL